MGLGRQEIVAEGGVTKIARAIKECWAGKLVISIKELHREGIKRDGFLARATAESMSSYVSRRKSLGEKFTIPEHLQMEMLADCAGISDHQQQLARLATERPLTLDTMCTALSQEYPLTHEKEASRKRDLFHQARKPSDHSGSNHTYAKGS